MDLEKALKIIKKCLNKNFLESMHFKSVCKDRNLEIEDIRRLIKKNKILGIINQNEKENVFKVCIHYRNDKDLYLVIKILYDKKVKLVTIFPENLKRRVREHETRK
jgi:hypothetical protein